MLSKFFALKKSKIMKNCLTIKIIIEQRSEVEIKVLKLKALVRMYKG